MTKTWREDDAEKTKPELTSGIPSTSFHRKNSKVRQRTTKALQRTLDSVKKNENKKTKEEISQEHKMRRSEYRKTSSLRTYGLQQPALEELERLKRQYLGEDEDEQTTEQKAKKDDKVTADGANDYEDEGVSSSSSWGSCESVEEAKRMKGGVLLTEEKENNTINSAPSLLSPAKCSPRERCRVKCLSDLDTMSKNNDPSSALWSTEPRIFSVETSKTGKRKYVVGHNGRFMDFYWRKVDPTSRHYYELITEDTPCRLYFDLEFHKASNSSLSEDLVERLLEEFYLELAAQFRSMYGIELGYENIIDLDSSTPKKFSRHWIVHLPNGELFRDAVSAGRFVKLFVGRLAEEIGNGSIRREGRELLAEHLFVNVEDKRSSTNEGDADCNTEDILEGGSGTAECLSNSSDTAAMKKSTVNRKEHDIGNNNKPYQNKKTPFVDLGVYTRNRLFRLIGSMKFGKSSSACLRIAERNKFPFPHGFGNGNFYQLANNGVSNGNGNGNFDETDISSYRASIDWSAHAEALAQTLVVPLNLPNTPNTILKDPLDIYNNTAKNGLFANDQTLNSMRTTRNPASLTNLTVNTSTQRTQRKSFQMGSSPFPILDDFVSTSLASRSGILGNIRSWSTDVPITMTDQQQLPKVISYSMIKNRFCENINKFHKSNNVIWIVNLMDMTYWQECHDPDCRLVSFKGKRMELQDYVVEGIREVLLEMEMMALDEMALLQQKKKRDAGNDAAFQIGKIDEEEEAEFEKALLAWNISDCGNPNSPSDDGVVVHGEDGVTESKSNDIKEEILMDQKKKISKDGPAALGLDDTFEDALFQAIGTNPELFP